MTGAEMFMIREGDTLMSEDELFMWARVQDEKYKQARLIKELIALEDECLNLSEDVAAQRAALAEAEHNLLALRAEIDERFPVSPKKEY